LRAESDPLPAWRFRRQGQWPDRLEDLVDRAVVSASLAFQFVEALPDPGAGPHGA